MHRLSRKSAAVWQKHTHLGEFGIRLLAAEIPPTARQGGCQKRIWSEFYKGDSSEQIRID
jgi:hypothetical protein